MRAKISKWIKSAALAIASFAGASAYASFSPVGVLHPGEAGQLQILEHQYGGDWHRVGDDFYNGTMSAKRMDDFLSDPSVLDVAKGACGYSTDQYWCGDKIQLTAVAKFSGNAQRLSLVDSDGQTTKALDVKGYGFNIEPATTTVNMHGDTFTFRRDGDGGPMFSVNSMNLDLRDHVITYVIEGLPGVSGPVWMMFFEDMNKLVNTPKNRTFADYNDLIVEVRSVVSAVPLPPASWAGLFTIAGGALVRSRKHIWRVVTA